MKCKITMEENRECQNCCFFCDKKDTCEDVCGEMEEKCEEQIEETDLQVIQSAVPDVLKAITDIIVQKKKLDEQEKVMKKKLQEAMETYGVKSFETPEVKFLYVAPTTRTTIDSKKLKADHPDIAEAYSKSRSLFCLLIKKERNYIYRLSISQFRSFNKLFISSSSLNCTHHHDAVILCNSNLLLYQ